MAGRRALVPFLRPSSHTIMGIIALCLCLVALSNLAYLAPSGSVAPAGSTTPATGGLLASSRPASRRALVASHGSHHATVQQQTAQPTQLDASRQGSGGAGEKAMAQAETKRPSRASFVCADVHEACPNEARNGRCRSSKGFAMHTCQKSCGVCAPLVKTAASWLGIPITSTDGRGSGCVDRLDICRYLAEQLHLCESPGERWWMRNMCPQSCGLCDKADENEGKGASAPAAPFVLGADERGSLVQATFVPSSQIPSDCKDTDESCPNWATLGECERNVDFMRATCAASCRACRFTIFTLPTPPHALLLNNGIEMPSIGFGSAALGDGTAAAVQAALEVGYRHVDSAMAREWYREDLVGQALSAFTAASGVAREQVFLTTKLHPKNLGRQRTLAALNASLADLGTDYVDLLLLHYPRCFPGLPGCTAADVARDSGGELWKESWRELEQLYQHGKARAIGVSNFGLHELHELVGMAVVTPQVLQTHVDPLAPAFELASFCVGHGIQLEAYSSLGTQWPLQQPGNVNPVLAHPGVKAAAHETRRTAAQVVLRWVLQQGAVVLPRSSNREHMSQSLQLFDFGLNEDQQLAVTSE